MTVYGYRSVNEVSVVEPRATTDALTSSAILKTTITGAHINAMSDIDIDIDGYLVDAEDGGSPADVWGLVSLE